MDTPSSTPTRQHVEPGTTWTYVHGLKFGVATCIGGVIGALGTAALQKPVIEQVPVETKPAESPPEDKNLWGGILFLLSVELEQYEKILANPNATKEELRTVNFQTIAWVFAIDECNGKNEKNETHDAIRQSLSMMKMFLKKYGLLHGLHAEKMTPSQKTELKEHYQRAEKMSRDAAMRIEKMMQKEDAKKDILMHEDL